LFRTILNFKNRRKARFQVLIDGFGITYGFVGLEISSANCGFQQIGAVGFWTSRQIESTWLQNWPLTINNMVADHFGKNAGKSQGNNAVRFLL